MKKTLCMLLALLMLLLAVSCTNTAQKPDDQTSASDTVGGTTAPTDADTSTPETGSVDIQGVDPVRTTVPLPDEAPTHVEIQFAVSRHFIDEMYLVNIVRPLVGDEAFFKYMDEVYANLSAEELAATPDLYKLIEYFDIPKADMLTLADDTAGEYDIELETWMVNALYDGSRTAMLEKLARATSLYHNGKVYSMYEVAALKENRYGVTFTWQELDVYVKRLVQNENHLYLKDLFNEIAAFAAALRYDADYINTATDFWGADGFRFRHEVSIEYIRVVIDEEAWDAYIAERKGLTDAEREATPGLYQALRDLDISKEEFSAAVAASEYASKELTPEIIDALYAEDMETMLRALAYPLSFYHDGVVYTQREMNLMSLRTCMELGITANELDIYLDQLAQEYNKDPSEFVWISFLADSLRSEAPME